MANNTVDRNGANGAKLLTSAEGAQTGLEVIMVEVLEDGTTFSTFTNSQMTGRAVTARTWKRGDRIPGFTTAITVSAGEVMAYNQV